MSLSIDRDLKTAEVLTRWLFQKFKVEKVICVKRPIKFRGKRLDNGELIYGDILRYGKYVICIRSYHFPDKESFSTLPVYSNSVAQLVGYDADGAEVYEGDVVQAPDGESYLMDISGIAYPSLVAECKLKKE